MFPTIIVVTPTKLLGANYGVMVAIPFSTVRPERAMLQTDDSDWGLNDMYVVPLYLGWHKPRADFVAGYGFFAPTGRYEAGASDNVGLGMWGHEIQFGTTVYADAAKKVSIATTAYIEMHSNKKDQDLKVGNMLTLEGGVAYNVPKIGGAFGLGYYLQNKLSDDSGADLPLDGASGAQSLRQEPAVRDRARRDDGRLPEGRHDRAGELPLSLGIGGEELVPGQHVHCGHDHREAKDMRLHSALVSPRVASR